MEIGWRCGFRWGRVQLKDLADAKAKLSKPKQTKKKKKKKRNEESERGGEEGLL